MQTVAGTKGRGHRVLAFSGSKEEPAEGFVLDSTLCGLHLDQRDGGEVFSHIVFVEGRGRTRCHDQVERLDSKQPFDIDEFKNAALGRNTDELKTRVTEKERDAFLLRPLVGAAPFELGHGV